jgi:hypothetical protein
MARIKRCGGKKHLHSLRKQCDLPVSRGRNGEKERAMAQQPELRVNYRFILRAYADRRFLELKTPEKEADRCAALKKHTSFAAID